MTPRYPDTTGSGRRIAVYAGSFDPFTRGHLSIVERVAPLFDTLIIAVGYNAAKAPSPDELATASGPLSQRCASSPMGCRSAVGWSSIRGV